MDAEPLPGVPMPLHIETVLPDPVDPDERRIELLAAIVVEAGAVALQEAVFAAVPFSLDIDRVVERRHINVRQKARLQDGVDECLTGISDGSFFADR